MTSMQRSPAYSIKEKKQNNKSALRQYSINHPKRASIYSMNRSYFLKALQWAKTQLTSQDANINIFWIFFEWMVPKKTLVLVFELIVQPPKHTFDCCRITSKNKINVFWNFYSHRVPFWYPPLKYFFKKRRFLPLICIVLPKWTFSAFYHIMVFIAWTGLFFKSFFSYLMCNCIFHGLRGWYNGLHGNIEG